MAVAALGRKERTTAELAAWLTERGCEADAIAAALERLIAIGELDDRRFATRYAEDKRELAGWGPERIRAALEARGVDVALVEAAVTEDGRGEQVERAALLLGRRGASLDDDSGRARAFGFLTRRGFDHEVAYAAIRRARSG